MQKDLSGATEAIAQGLNDLHASNSNATKSLMELVKRQAAEIDRRGQMVMSLEESVQLQQDNLKRLAQQNKHLESLVDSLRSEREKLLEEVSLLQEVKTEVSAKPKTSKKKVKKVAENDTTAEADLS